MQGLRVSICFLLFLFLIPDLGRAQTVVPPLPELYEIPPDRIFQPLGTVGAAGKSVGEARAQLQREALKVSADAVVAVSCREGGIEREGLTWSKQDPYCRGMAVKYLKENPLP